MTGAVHTPDWVKQAVFYQIFPDRFARSARLEKPGTLETWESPPTIHGFKGGDLLGIVEHLDYLSQLGVTAIYLNPVFQSASNHRYHTHDYYQVDPLLGGNPAFGILLEEAHRAGMRVVLDGVFNHASRGFFPFNHLLECGAQSPYVDWFRVHGFPLNAYGGRPNYDCWVGLPALPEFNTNNPQVRRFIFDIARYWIEQGCDGWRLDVPTCIDDDSFWQEFRQVVKTANPEAYLVGEIVPEAQRWLQGDQFDAVMNYQLTQACLGYFAGNRIDRQVERNMMGMPTTAVLDAPGFARRVEELLRLYPAEIASAQLNLLDSHDMPRFINLAGGDQASLRLAALFTLTYPGAPCIYYGDEIGMQGGSSRSPEPSRGGFPWEAARWDHDLLRFYQEAIALRRAHPALATGEFIPLLTAGQVLVFQRRSAGESLVVAFNAGETPWTGQVELAGGLPDGMGLKPLLGEDRAGAAIGGRIELQLPGRVGTVYQVDKVS